jgi:hypothetical protein
MSSNTQSILGTGASPASVLTNDLAGLTADASGRYRAWVTQHPVAAALLAGLVATHVATIIGYWMPGIGLPQLDWNRVNGMIYTPTASVDVQFLSGGIFHYLDGLVFSVLYAAALFPLLRWRSTVVGNLLKGLLFGTVLATISCAFMTPRVYFPNQDVGFFSHNLGWQTILAVYLWHWVFGAHLGAIYNPEEERSSVTHHQTYPSSNGTGDVAVVSRSPARPAL